MVGTRSSKSQEGAKEAEEERPAASFRFEQFVRIGTAIHSGIESKQASRSIDKNKYLLVWNEASCDSQSVTACVLRVSATCQWLVLYGYLDVVAQNMQTDISLSTIICHNTRYHFFSSSAPSTQYLIYMFHQSDFITTLLLRPSHNFLLLPILIHSNSNNLLFSR